VRLNHETSPHYKGRANAICLYNIMNDIELWMTIVLAALVTFLLRYLPMKLLEKQRLAPWLERALRYVPAATLSGLVFPALLLQNNKLALSFANDRLIAGIFAIVLAYFSRNAVLTIVGGLVALWILQRF
jgi:branched-subunit amino acid transport protein